MTLDEFILALIISLRQCDPIAYDRMCHVVGNRTARVQLDSQSVWVRVVGGVLDVDAQPPEGPTEDGHGATDTATVLALLRGDLEVSEAILNESLAVRGEIEEINRMFMAIEILLDAVPRCPVLQKISAQFVTESQPSQLPNVPVRANWYPFAVSNVELDFLARFGLLPGKQQSQSNGT